MNKWLLSLLLLAVSVTSAFAADINGKWKTTMVTPDGSPGPELIFTFVVKGDTLTGNSASEMGEVTLTNGKVAGKTFTFDVDVNGMVIGHKCALVSDDEISMEISGFGPDSIKAKLTRVKEEAPKPATK